MKRMKVILKFRINFLGLICLFFLFSSSNSIASPPVEDRGFDSVFYHTAVNVAANDVNKALLIADSLFVNSKSNLNKVKSLMLSSSLYQQKGDLANSIQTAEKAYLTAEKNKIYEWQARISGFLATQYRIMEMYEESERYLVEGIRYSKKVDNVQMSYLYQGLILQERTYFFLAKDEAAKALKSAQEAEINFKKLESERDRKYFLISNLELLGRVCVEMKDWNSAENYLTQALDGLNEEPNNDLMVKGRIYSSLGRVYFEQHSLELAIENLLSAEKLLEPSHNLPLEVEVFKTMADYYHFTKDYDKYVIYNEKYIASLIDSEKKKKESINQYVESTKAKGTEIKKNRDAFIVLSIALSLLIIALIIFFKNKQKKEKILFQKIMQRIESSDQNFILKSDSVSNDCTKEQEEDCKILMTEDTENYILEKLDEFEKGDKFLDNNISSSKLAGIIETNNKYLSHILNTHKKVNFSSYINELRIKYIIKKLNDNQQYRNFKISYLAEETGYSSHTKFSQAFKSVTGLSPSIFLKELEKTSA